MSRSTDPDATERRQDQEPFWRSVAIPLRKNSPKKPEKRVRSSRFWCLNGKSTKTPTGQPPMAKPPYNPEHLEIVKTGKDAIAEFRKANPKTRFNLIVANAGVLPVRADRLPRASES